MKKFSEISLNGFHIKLIGWIFTLFHLAAMLFFPLGDSSVVRVILSFLGYISLPFFAFMLVEGFAYTDNRIRYVLMLAAVAIITEPFFDYYLCGSWLDFDSANGQNILFAYVFGFIQLYFISYMGTGTWLRTVCTVIMVICCALWMDILNIPSGGCVQLLVGIFYLLHEHPRVKNWAAAVAAFLSLGTAALAIPVITRYNDEPGEYNKYLFYAAYPAVWIVAALLKLALA